MFYFMTVSYNIPDCILSDATGLFGPYASAEERDAAMKLNMESRDLECTEVVNVTLLKIENGWLALESSSLAGGEGDNEEDCE